MMKKTKIIATLGPVSESPEMIETLLKAGANVFRLNFSHGNHEEHGQRIDNVREISAKLGLHAGILADLQGPKIRIGEYDGYLHKSDLVTLVCGEPKGEEIPVQYLGLCKDVKTNDILLLDDGLIELKVQSVTGIRILCKVTNGGKLTSKKGINLSTGTITADVITDKDRADAVFALSKDVDFLALSFVRDANDIHELRDIIKKSGKDVQIIAKIERHEAIDNFEEILEATDAVMVARGDLGVEVSQQKVPLIQKHIVKRCLAVGKPVIVATQMLDSMIRNPRSTRAETSDIANAILDGADAIMLSGETANGKYPKLAVQAMNRIAMDTEAWIVENKIVIGEHVKHDVHKLPEAVAQAAFMLAKETGSRYILAATTTGRNARAIAKFRPYQLVIAGTDSESTARRLALTWGAWPVVIDFKHNRELTDKVTEVLKSKRMVRNGEYLTLVSGITQGKIGGTNMIRMHKIPEND
jgi:pyruvate kinase